MCRTCRPTDRKTNPTIGRTNRKCGKTDGQKHRKNRYLAMKFWGSRAQPGPTIFERRRRWRKRNGSARTSFGCLCVCLAAEMWYKLFQIWRGLRVSQFSYHIHPEKGHVPKSGARPSLVETPQLRKTSGFRQQPNANTFV